MLKIAMSKTAKAFMVARNKTYGTVFLAQV